MSLLGLMPFFPLYYNGTTKFTPVHATDVAEVICHIISKEIYSKDIEVIGPEVLSFKDIMIKIMNSINKKRILIKMPLLVAKISASFLEILPNPLITKDQLNLLKYDNVSSGLYKTNYDFNINVLKKFEDEIEKYSYNWRSGGQYTK